MSSVTSVESLTQDLEHIDPEKTSSLMMAVSHHLPLFLPKAACLPGPQLGARFWRDLGRRPVLLWTAQFRSGGGRALSVPAPPGGECGLRGGGARLHCARPGEARRGKALPSATSKPSPWSHLMAWGSQTPGWDAVTPPGNPGTARAAAERALGAVSRPSGPLGRPGPAARSPTPRSRRLSRPHPGRSQPRTLECQEGRRKTQLPSPLPPLAPGRGRAGQCLARCEGRTPRQPLAAVQLPPGCRAHLLARASARSPPLPITTTTTTTPAHERAASCGTGHPSRSSLPTQQRPALGYRGKQNPGRAG